MHTHTFENDINVFGMEVVAFPSGVSEAFDNLIKKTGDSAGARDYYGVSFFEGGKMVYYALAAEKFAGEAEKLNYKRLIIEKGSYVATTLDNWRSKTDCIKDVFDELIKDSRVDKTKPAIEWYINDQEMTCLVKLKM